MYLYHVDRFQLPGGPSLVRNQHASQPNRANSRLMLEQKGITKSTLSPRRV
jgi:hypothetical protein